MIEILSISGECSSAALGAFLIIAKRVIGFIRILVPILLIIATALNFIKLMQDPNNKKGLKPVINSILAAIIVFFVPTIVNVVMGLLDDSFTIASCWNSVEETNFKSSYVSTTENNRKNPAANQGEYQEGNPRKTPTPGGSSNADSGVNVSNSTNGLIPLSYNGWDYYLYVPKNVDQNKPLIVFLHGNYNQGHNLKKLHEDGGYAAHINAGAEYPAYILLPLLPSGSWTSGSNTATLMELIEKTVNENGIDRRRISLQGFSMGADETAAIVASHPDYFASEVIMSISIQAYRQSYGTSLKNVPTRIYYGNIDPYAGGCVPLYNALSSAGGDVELYTFQGHGHAYLPRNVLDDKNSDVISWVLSKSRS